MFKKEVSETMIILSQRVTKYPLMIDALLKYSKGQDEESLMLSKALTYVKVRIFLSWISLDITQSILASLPRIASIMVWLP